jgi:hypothetical protein
MVASASIALGSLAFAQAAAPAPAPQNQIDVGLGIYDTDPTGVYSNFEPTATYGQAGKYSPSMNASGKYTFTLPLDSSNTLKFALGDDDWYGFYTGSASNQSGESNQNAGSLTPLVEYLGYGADVTLSAPLYYLSPSDAGGYNELGYAYKETGYLPIGHKTTSTYYPLDSADSLIATINLKAFYKYSFDKTTSITAGAAMLYAYSPTAWPVDFLPKVTVNAFGAQLDLQYDLYNNYNDNAQAYQDQYLEPKLTYDLGFMKLVPGLKVYVSSRISLATNNPAYTVAGSAQPFHDTFVQPGVNYSISVPKVGSFTVDAGWRFAKIDNVGTLGAANSGKYTASSTNANDVAPYDDLRIGAMYTYKF